MKKAASTPTPWSTDPAFKHEAVLGADGVQVADCSIFVNPAFADRSPAVNRANAALIAATVNEHQPLLIELAGYKAALRQIAAVCRDNAPETSNHRLALKFVESVARGVIKNGAGS